MRNKLFLYALIFTGLIFSSTVYASNQHCEAFVDYDKDENLIEKAVYFNKGISVILNREINKETLNNAVIKKADGTSVNTYLSYDEASRNLTAVTDFDISADYVLDLSGITDSYNIPISEKVTANMKEKVKISGVRFYNEFSEDITSLGANESKKISAKYYAADAGEMSQSGNAILALYKDGALTDVSIKEFSSYNALSEISVEKSRIENGYTAKLFFLDGFIEPLARAYTLPASLPETEVEGKQLVSAEIELDNTEVIAKDLTPGKFSTSSGTVKDVFYYPAENTVKLVFDGVVRKNINISMVTGAGNTMDKLADNIRVSNGYECAAEMCSVTLTELYPIDNDNAILLVTVYNPLNFGFDMTLRVSSEAVDRNLFTHIHANARTILGCLVDLRNNMDVTVEGKE